MINDFPWIREVRNQLNGVKMSLFNIYCSYHMVQMLFCFDDEVSDLNVILDWFVNFNIIKCLNDTLNQSSRDSRVLIIKLSNLRSNVSEPISIWKIDMLSSDITLTCEERCCLFHVEITLKLISIPTVVFFLNQFSEENFEIKFKLRKLKHQVDQIFIVMVLINDLLNLLWDWLSMKHEPSNCHIAFSKDV